MRGSKSDSLHTERKVNARCNTFKTARILEETPIQCEYLSEPWVLLLYPHKVCRPYVLLVSYISSDWLDYSPSIKRTLAYDGMFTSFAPERPEDRTDWLSHVAMITIISARISVLRDSIWTRRNKVKWKWVEHHTLVCTYIYGLDELPNRCPC